MGAVQGELTTARQLTAELLPVAGNVITGDALYCQRDYCQQLLDAGGDYLVIVKKNQRELYDAIALGVCGAGVGSPVPAGPAAGPSRGSLGDEAVAGYGGAE